MGNKVSLSTIEGILNEVDKARADRSRVISDITDRKVREIIKDCSSYSLKHGIPSLGIAAGLGVGLGAAGTATGIGIAGGAAAGGAAGGTIIGASSGVAFGSGTMAGILGGGAAAGEGAAAGAAAGSVVPVLGTIIGAGFGLVLGGIVGATIKGKQNKKREQLYQEAIRKQNEQIKALKDEVDSLKIKFGKTKADNDRLEYLFGVLMGFSDSKEILRVAA